MRRESYPELRPLDYAGILDGTLSLWKEHAGLFTAIAAAALLPLLAAQLAGQAWFPVTLDPSTLRPHIERPLFWTLLQGVDLIVSLIGNGAIIAAVCDLLLGRTPSVSAALAAAVSRLVALTTTGLLVAVLVIIGFKLMLFPGYLAGLLCAFAAPVVMLEGLRGAAAVRRSAALVCEDGQWLRVVVLAGALLLLLGCASAMAFALVDLVTPAGGAGIYLRMGAGLLVQLVAMPIALIAGTLLYIDVRVRREAYSLGRLETERDGR